MLNEHGDPFLQKRYEAFVQYQRKHRKGGFHMDRTQHEQCATIDNLLSCSHCHNYLQEHEVEKLRQREITNRADKIKNDSIMKKEERNKNLCIGCDEKHNGVLLSNEAELKEEKFCVRHLIKEVQETASREIVKNLRHK